MTQLEIGNREDWEDNEDVSDSDNNSCVALTEWQAAHSDADSATAALRTARQLLIDRAEAEKAIGALEERKRQLREQQDKALAYTETSLPLRLQPEEELDKALEGDSSGQALGMTPIKDAVFGSQSGSGNSNSKSYDALTTDRGREIFRRLMILREVTGRMAAPVDDSKKASVANEGPSSQRDTSSRMAELKQLQGEIDQREISLQQAEEAVQARAALRRIEAEHAKNMQKKQEEFEEQRQKEAKQAREEIARQQKEYEEQLAKERERCDALRKEMELQAKELDLQRRLAEERLREKSQKQHLELEEELSKLRKQQRETEIEMQRIAAEAMREASAIKSAATDEKASLSAAAQAAERKANDALKLVKEKEEELKALQERLRQALSARTAAPPSSPAPPFQVVAKEPSSPSTALSEPASPHPFKKCAPKRDG